MEKYFTTYDQSLALKELGFDIPVNASWIINKMYPRGIIGFGSWQNSNSSDNHLSAPLKQQVFRWFREKYEYWSYIKEATKGTCRFNIEKFDENFFTSGLFGSYDEAESACIDKLIEIIKKK
jgi:hypothetical protein